MTKQGISISIFLLALLVVGGFFAFMRAPITEEVSVTPPTDDNTRIAAGYISGKVIIGPSCGGPEIEGQPCVTPPEAYTSREVVVYTTDGTEETRMHLDITGNYKIAVAPGNHLVQIVPAGIGPGEKKPATVKSWETTVIDFDIDTGIR